MKKIYDSRHQGYTISNWQKRGIICREGENYKDLYYLVMSITNCELCNIELVNGNCKNGRCLDHDHTTGFFRKVLCRGCNTKFMVTPQKLRKNSKTGHKWLGISIQNDRPNKVPRVSFTYTRRGFKRKSSTSLTKLIALSFIHILKKPI